MRTYLTGGLTPVQGRMARMDLEITDGVITALGEALSPLPATAFWRWTEG